MPRKVKTVQCVICETDQAATLVNEHGACVYCRTEGKVDDGAAREAEEAVVQRRMAEEREKRRDMYRRRMSLEKARSEKAARESAQGADFEAVAEAKKELARRELARQHLLPLIMRVNPDYMPGWVHKDICEHLEWFSEAVAAGESPRLMLFMPPRHGKSEIASRVFPGWHLGRHPKHEVIACSYAGSLANDFSRKVRGLFRDPSYQSVFEEARLAKDSQSIEQWNLEQGGGYTAAGVGGPITGKGAHVLIIDDPVKNREEAESASGRQSIKDWYTSTAYTRLAPGGGVLIILTRWHDDDLAGWLLSQGEKGEGDEWKVVRYPALAEYDELFRAQGEALHPDRYDVTALERIKRAVGPRDWSALYQQNPVADDGDYFKAEYIQYYNQQDLPPLDELSFYTAWDLAIGQTEVNDFSVGITVGVDRRDNIYVVDVQRGRWSSLELVEKMLDTQLVWGSRIVGIERGHIEMTMRPILEKRSRERRINMPIEELRPGRQDKIARARPIQARLEQRRVFFRRHCDVTSALIGEMLRFPNGKNDDQVDAIAWIGQMLMTFTSTREKKPKPTPSWRDKLHRSISSANNKRSAMSA